MVYPDGYYFQERLFYSSQWSKAMEWTLVDALVDHKNNGHFLRDGVNSHAVLCSICDVNKQHGTQHTYDFAQNKVKKLKKRHALFSWLIDLSAVTCNKVDRYVVATDAIWERIIKERVLAKCYVNAYEDFFDHLCMLFDGRTAEEAHVYSEGEVDSIASFSLWSGWVDDVPPLPMENLVEANVNELEDGPADSTSLWRFLEEYYASDDDEVESILALPGIPHTMKRPPYAPPPSPNSSYVSLDNASSSSSNDINMSE
ncbi:hypothetical protein Salat_2573600 [Sesamum alatum]|uniref:Myb/SANT-like domain-containing protein n=1 Tax=Sesamum alatum TaxID=300844 RepID=A0AAE1XTV0_9LAMI|nr:hypothetical protein Salat_2573600 [Sesamum alatum]